MWNCYHFSSLKLPLLVTSELICFRKGGFSLPGLRPVSVAYGGIMEFQRHESSPMSFDTSTPQSSHSVSLRSELEAQTPKKGELNDEKEQLNNSVSVTEKATATSELLVVFNYTLHYIFLGICSGVTVSMPSVCLFVCLNLHWGESFWNIGLAYHVNPAENG